MTDWNEIYKQQRRAAERGRRLPENWDARAASMRDDNEWNNSYVKGFHDLTDCGGCRDALDIGCGTGALLVPLAARLDAATGVDFSVRMLEEARERARAAGASNIALIQANWETETERLPRADLVIASRCLDVDDMRAALERLESLARKRVCVSYRRGRSHVDEAVLDALGRSVVPRPDSDLIPRILEQMGRDPVSTVIATPRKTTVYPDADAFLARLRWSLDPLTDEEEARARLFFECLPVLSDGRREHVHAIEWAYVRWDI